MKYELTNWSTFIWDSPYERKGQKTRKKGLIEKQVQKRKKEKERWEGKKKNYLREMESRKREKDENCSQSKMKMSFIDRLSQHLSSFFAIFAPKIFSSSGERKMTEEGKRGK